MHGDIVHDVAYDHYGRRVATCSSDNTIKVFNDVGHKVAEWKAHNGSIWRLSWAHPEFGVALASCSFDRRVCIWEETADAEELIAAANGKLSGRMASWPRVAEIADARDSVVDVQFAPHHMGVRVASCSADGFVRVHEAPDVLDLSSWEKHSEFDASVEIVDGASGVPMLSNAALGVGGSSSSIGGDMSSEGRRSNEPLCLAWCSSAVENPMLVIGMADGHVLLWCSRDSGWVRTLALGVGGVRCHHDCVRSVSWATDVGRSYQLVATGSRDKLVKLWVVQRSLEEEESSWAVAEHTEGGGGGTTIDAVGDRWTARCCAELPHCSQVWRVTWNASGSMLATSEDDGTVKVYQMDENGGWRQAKPVAVD